MTARTKVRRPDYVNRVGFHLHDLPAAERDAVLDDLAANLAEIDLPPDDVDGWTDRLGPVRDYAVQLRSGLGLPVDERAMRRASRPSLLRSSRGAKATVTAVVLLLATLAGWQVWARNSDPLVFGGFFSGSGGPESVSVGTRSRDTWTWRRGGGFSLRTFITNEGSVPVRISAMPLPDIDVAWDRWEVGLIDDESQSGDPDAARPFAPFTLGPGEQQIVQFRGHFDECPQYYGPGSGLGISTQRVDFELLGTRRTELLDIGVEYMVVVPAEGCSP